MRKLLSIAALVLLQSCSASDGPQSSPTQPFTPHSECGDDLTAQTSCRPLLAPLTQAQKDLFFAARKIEAVNKGAEGLFLGGGTPHTPEVAALLKLLQDGPCSHEIKSARSGSVKARIFGDSCPLTDTEDMTVDDSPTKFREVTEARTLVTSADYAVLSQLQTYSSTDSSETSFSELAPNLDRQTVSESIKVTLVGSAVTMNYSGNSGGTSEVDSTDPKNPQVTKLDMFDDQLQHFPGFDVLAHLSMKIGDGASAEELFLNGEKVELPHNFAAPFREKMMRLALRNAARKRQ